jgi:hypothetical protein
MIPLNRNEGRLNSKIKRWEALGIIFIVIFGASLHFLFEWTGYWRPAALIAGVNESTWEHFKIAFWPSFLWAAIEFFGMRLKAPNFFIAKAAGFLLMPVVTGVLFYGYTAVTGEHFLIADIIIFIISVTAGQLMSARLMIRKSIQKPWLRPASIIVLFLITAAFSTLSYYPLDNFIFQHPESYEIGILSDYDHDDH